MTTTILQREDNAVIQDPLLEIIPGNTFRMKTTESILQATVMLIEMEMLMVTKSKLNIPSYITLLQILFVLLASFVLNFHDNQ